MLSALQELRQFIVWKLVTAPTAPKPLKVPINYQTGIQCDAHDAANWTDFNTATQMAPLVGGTGVGFVLTPLDPFCCMDLDACLQADRTWSPFAKQMMSWFPEAATELSYSGNGLHLWFQYDLAQLPPNHKTRDAAVPGLEVYTSRRFIAMGPRVYRGSAATDCTPALLHTLATYLPGAATQATDWSDEPVPEWNGPTDDKELIAKMLAAKQSAASVFGGKASFRDLWAGNAEALAGTYPSDTGDDFNHSSADAALMSHLAFWTGKDCARMDTLFRRSALIRAKYIDRPYYQQKTITEACGWTTDVYSAPVIGVPVAAPDFRPTTLITKGVLREGLQYLTLSQQLEYFDGCVYIQMGHRIFSPKWGVLHPDVFRARYDGYEFAMSADGVKPTKSSYEAFMSSRGLFFPKVFAAKFRPDQPMGCITTEQGDDFVNTYIPPDIYVMEGDVTPFINHMAALFTDERDRQIIMSYMAALVQFPGDKFQWAPLIQGLEGNGKSFLFHVLSYCVGYKYRHLPNASDIANKFNSWIDRKIFIGVEELYVSDKREVSDALKPLITNTRIEIQAKGADQITGDNRANFMLTSNHKDAIWKTNRDRRYAIFFTAQQEPGDLERDGLQTPYGPNLYNWARNGGFAAIAHYLFTYQIDQRFNPATRNGGTCDRAPITSSTGEAIAVSVGGLEQEVFEAIESGQPGFLGGWVSSTALTVLLEKLHATRAIRRNKRRDMLKQMGYIPHPNLPHGRLTTPVMQEGNRPTLYVLGDHVSLQLTDPLEIHRAYVRAQGWDAGEIKAPPVSSLKVPV